MPPIQTEQRGTIQPLLRGELREQRVLAEQRAQRDAQVGGRAGRVHVLHRVRRGPRGLVAVVVGSEAIGAVYGAEAAETFLGGTALWRDHISFFVDYTTALAKKDKAGQDKAVNDLMGYVEAFSSFLAEATGLPKGALRDSIGEHVNQLKAQIDAYAAGDYEQAYTLLREATHHMWMTGDTLAEAIVGQSPDGFSS